MTTPEATKNRPAIAGVIAAAVGLFIGWGFGVSLLTTPFGIAAIILGFIGWGNKYPGQRLAALGVVLGFIVASPLIGLLLGV